MSKIKSIFSPLFFLALSFLMLGYAREAGAQVLYGSVSGTIADQSGAGVPRAHVTMTNRGTGVVREAEADENGYYRITDVPPGNYDLRVTATGFKPLTQTNLTVAANTVKDADVQLQVGAVSEQVARAMAKGALERSPADLAVAVTGVAGPTPDPDGNPVGLVHIVAARRSRATMHVQKRYGDLGRDTVLEQTMVDALLLLERVASQDD